MVGVLRDPILVADWRAQEVAGCLLWPHPYPLVALGTHTLGAGGGGFPGRERLPDIVVRALGVQHAGPYPELPTAPPVAQHSLSNLLFPHLCKWG